VVGAAEVEVVVLVPECAWVDVVDVDRFRDAVSDRALVFAPTAVRFGAAPLHAARIRPRQSTLDAAKILGVPGWKAWPTIGSCPASAECASAGISPWQSAPQRCWE